MRQVLSPVWKSIAVIVCKSSTLTVVTSKIEIDDVVCSTLQNNLIGIKLSKFHKCRRKFSQDNVIFVLGYVLEFGAGQRWCCRVW